MTSATTATRRAKPAKVAPEPDWRAAVVLQAWLGAPGREDQIVQTRDRRLWFRQVFLLTHATWHVEVSWSDACRLWIDGEHPHRLAPAIRRHLKKLLGPSPAPAVRRVKAFGWEAKSALPAG